jgi:hypothetical protein
MPECPVRKPLLQFYLSTWIVWVLLAGALLAPQFVSLYGPPYHHVVETLGWPYPFLVDYESGESPILLGALATDVVVYFILLASLAIPFHVDGRGPLHLHWQTTALISLEAGVLYWLNTRYGEWPGWPEPFLFHLLYDDWPAASNLWGRTRFVAICLAGPAFANMACWWVIVFYTAAPCEWWLRRREASRHAAVKRELAMPSTGPAQRSQ